MAKRKKAKKGATRRRRRVGAMALTANSPLVMYGSMAAGFLAGDTINLQIDKITGTMDAKLVGAGQAGIGAALVFMKLGKRKTLPEVAVGGLLVGSGVKRLAKTFGLINGIGGYAKVPVIGRHQMNGYNKVPVIGNGYTANRSALNGALNGGYTVPRPAQGVMGSATAYGSGSGYGGNSDYRS